MDERITRPEAAMLLGVTVSADVDEVKRRYRRLARRHHPDAGGDAAHFHTLHRAYLRLLESDAPGRAEPVATQPSRTPAPPPSGDAQVRVDVVDWDRPFPGRAAPLDADGVAIWLADAGLHAVRALEATSRAPGSRLNRLAHLLSPELTSSLRIGELADHRGGTAVVIEVIGANRRARRVLDAAALAPHWVRTRRSTTSRLSCELTPSPDPRATAVRARDELVTVLDELHWPLSAWRIPTGP